MSIQRQLYLERMKKLIEMDPKKHVKKNPENGMFCVYNNEGKKVKEFKSEADATKYATDNHDDLMKKDVDEAMGSGAAGLNPNVAGGMKAAQNTPSYRKYLAKVKSDKEQRDKKLEADRAAKKGKNEEVEEGTYDSKKALADARKQTEKNQKARLKQDKADKKSKNEEVEEVDELKKSTIMNYKDKAKAQKNDIARRNQSVKGPLVGKDADQYIKRGKGVDKAAKKLVARQYESVELSEADKVMINELFLFITNDAQLYKQRITPLIKNYQKKMKKGIFDQDMAVKGFLYAVNDGIKKYNKEFGAGSMKLSKQEKEAVATKLLDYYQEELAGG